MMPVVAVVSKNEDLVASVNRIKRSGIDLQLLAVFPSPFSAIEYCSSSKILPDFLILDFDLLEFDCLLSTEYLSEQFPFIRVVVPLTPAVHTNLSQLLKAGVWGLLADSSELAKLNTKYIKRNIAFGELFSIGIVDSTFYDNRKKEIAGIRKKLGITKREATFISLNATGIEYSDIAKLMFVERKTVDNLFTNVSRKLGIKNRLNLTLYSIRVGLACIMVEAPLSQIRQ